MKHQFNLISFIGLISLNLLFSQSALSYKCWTNNEGIKECCDRLPPEYAQQGHEKVGKHGLVKEKAERVKTDEELAEEKRIAKILEEENKKIEAARLRDKVLLDTYSNVEDMEAIREERVAAIDSTLTLSDQQLEKLNVDLEERMAKMAEKERNGKTPSEAEVNDIEVLQRQVENKEAFIAKKQSEKVSTNEQFDSDIQRFKELKGIKE